MTTNTQQTELERCVNILTEHNKWRRGESPYDVIPCESPSPSPKELGQAIDYVTQALLDMEGEIRMEQGNYAGAMYDNEALVAAFRKRMPNDEWLNLNYPINKTLKGE